jgi:hypothetical protein
MGLKNLQEIYALLQRQISERAFRLSSAHDPEKWEPVFGKNHAQNMS